MQNDKKWSKKQKAKRKKRIKTNSPGNVYDYPILSYIMQDNLRAKVFVRAS